MRQPLVAGNWKMNGSKASVAALVSGLKVGLGAVQTAKVVVCPPYVYIPQVADLLKGSAIALGAQNISHEAAGAYTGEVAASMLVDFGCQYVIVGHSERRSLYGESDLDVAKKYLAALGAGLTPILCVGELLQEREQGQTENVVARQLDAVIAAAGIDKLAKGVIAYEPVWAIGTGKTASPEQAQEVHAFIRSRLAKHSSTVANAMQILYGGSVKPDNAALLFGMRDIDGGLIGGASLDAEGFLAICRAAR